MLKPLTTTFQGREITLECTHKREFPPPQMYGSTPEDIDTLWKQGTIDQNQYQHLKVWHDKCGLMVMGPRCLDCPLALKQNPRPGRPHVIETENWLEAKNKMHWADMKAGKLAPPPEQEAGVPQMPLGPEESTPIEGAPFAGQHDEEYPVDPPEPEETTASAPESTSIADILSGSEETEDAEDEQDEEGADLDDDIISALADD